VHIDETGGDIAQDSVDLKANRSRVLRSSAALKMSKSC
jgi:hypothetical protein